MGPSLRHDLLLAQVPPTRRPRQQVDYTAIPAGGVLESWLPVLREIGELRELADRPVPPRRSR